MHRRPFPYLILLACAIILMFIYFHHKLQETAAKSDRLSRKCLTSTINETDVVAIVQDMHEIKEHRQLLFEQRQENEDVKEKFEVVAHNLDSLNREATKDVERTTEKVEQVARQAQQQSSLTEGMVKKVALLQSQVAKLKQALNTQMNTQNQVIARLAKPRPVSRPINIDVPVSTSVASTPVASTPVASTPVKPTAAIVLGNWEALDNNEHSTPLTPPQSPLTKPTGAPIDADVNDSSSRETKRRSGDTTEISATVPVEVVRSESTPTEQLESEKLPSFDFAEDVEKSSQ